MAACGSSPSSRQSSRSSPSQRCPAPRWARRAHSARSSSRAASTRPVLLTYCAAASRERLYVVEQRGTRRPAARRKANRVLPGHPRPRRSTAASRVCSGSRSIRATRPTALLRGLHVEGRATTRSPATGRTAARALPSSARRSSWPSTIRTRTTTAATSSSGRTAASTSSIGDGGSGGDPEDRAQNMQSQFGKLLRLDVSKPVCGLEIAGARAAEPLAILVRPRNGRPVHRATSARARSRRSTSRRARARASRTTAGTCTKARGASRTSAPGPGKLVFPVYEYSHEPGLHASPAATSTADRRGRPSAAATSSATTAAGSSGASGWPRARRRTFASSRSGSEGLSSFGENAAGELFAMSHERDHLPRRPSSRGGGHAEAPARGRRTRAR